MQFDALFHYCPVCGSSHWEKRSVKSMQCLDCKFVWYVNPSSAVAAFICNENGELLVGVRGKEPAKGTLDLPGGFVDDNESAEDAVAREIMEETSVPLKEASYVFSLPNEYTYSGWTLPTLDMFFVVKLADESQVLASDDVESLSWMPLEKIDPEKFGLKSIRKAVKIFIDSNSKK